jgi:tetratricopeptide (TPR) repeat protein
VLDLGLATPALRVYISTNDAHGALPDVAAMPGDTDMPQAKKPRKQAAAAMGSRPAGLPLPDRRAMETFLAPLSGGQADAVLYQAQDLMYQAWETRGRQARINLAKRALKVSPLCADAYVLLAEESARSVEEARKLYARGVEAGELALGPKTFKEEVGYFWGLLETRPYMRARAGLAQALWTLGSRSEAIAHYRDMLRLNPGDNQGIRYILAAALLEIGDDKALQELLQAYDQDGSPYWTYTKALLAFRAAGATKKAKTHLAQAIEANAHVPAFLSGEKVPPKTSPEYITLGGEDEAAEYARDCGDAWRQTAGAIEWLQQVATELPSPSRRRPQPLH